MNIKVPYLAEGVDSGVVVNILVKEGDEVTKGQTVVELETNKATAPIPSTISGKVSKILVKTGDEVKVGQSLIALTDGTSAEEKETSREVKNRKLEAFETAGKAQKDAVESKEFKYESKSGLPPPASPEIRKLARELAIDLTRVAGSARGGRITKDDLKKYIESLQKRSLNVPKTDASVQKVVVPSIDFSKWGPIEKKSLSPTRRTIGEKMLESWTTIPHVTQFDEADITDLMTLRKKYLPEFEKKGAKLTLTALALIVVCDALKKYPLINSSYDESTKELVYKKYYNVGVAVDTEQGLLVPVVKNADKKSLLELSIELDSLAEKTRARKLSIDEMQGGSFTISNLGSVGGAHFTPIINKPEVAILGVGKGNMKSVLKNNKTDSRMMLPLALSYDHRIVDGADGARFIRAIVERFENFDEKYFKMSLTQDKRKSK